MPNTGNKIFDNRRKWLADIDNAYIQPLTPDTYLVGTHSFSFQIYIERDCDIELYLDTTIVSATLSSYTINYTFTGSVQTFPITIPNILPNNYNFRIKVVDLSNTYEYGVDIDTNTAYETNDLNGPFGPYFSPVYDSLSCPVGSTESIIPVSTTTTSTTTTTTTIAPPTCSISGTILGYIII